MQSESRIVFPETLREEANDINKERPNTVEVATIVLPRLSQADEDKIRRRLRDDGGRISDGENERILKDYSVRPPYDSE
jgi:hypothetical protein